MDDRVRRLRRMVDWLGGVDGKCTWVEYYKKYDKAGEGSDYSKADLRQELTDYADLLDELRHQCLDKPL